MFYKTTLKMTAKFPYLFIIITICCFILSPSIGLSSEPLACYKSDSLWYFVDNTGEQMFPPIIASEVMGYSDGLIRTVIKGDGKLIWSFYDKNGKLVFKPDCDYIYDFSEGMALAFNIIDKGTGQKKYGFYDSTGKLAIPFTYDDAYKFSEGLAYVSSVKGNWFIDKSGKMVIDLGSDAGSIFSEGLVAVNNMSFKTGYLDKNGKTIIGFKFDEAGSFSGGFAKYNYNAKFGYIDRSGHSRIKPEFEFAADFKNGRAFVGITDMKFNTHWALIDSSGNRLTDFVFSKKEDFNDNMAVVRTDSIWGFIDTTGKFLIEPKYWFASNFAEGLAWVSDRKEGKFGFINQNGEYIITLTEAEKYFDLRLNLVLYK